MLKTLFVIWVGVEEIETVEPSMRRSLLKHVWHPKRAKVGVYQVLCWSCMHTGSKRSTRVTCEGVGCSFLAVRCRQDNIPPATIKKCLAVIIFTWGGYSWTENTEFFRELFQMKPFQRYSKNGGWISCMPRPWRFKGKDSRSRHEIMMCRLM